MRPGAPTYLRHGLICGAPRTMHKHNVRMTFLLLLSFPIGKIFLAFHMFCLETLAKRLHVKLVVYLENVGAAESRLIKLDYGRAYDSCYLEMTQTSSPGNGSDSINFDIRNDADEPVT